MLWVLVVILQGTKLEPDYVYFSDLSTCIEYREKVTNQNISQRVAGDKIYIKAYCIPKKKE